MGWNKWWIKKRYNNTNIRFKAATIRSHLSDYSEAYILVKETITVSNKAAASAAVNNTNKEVTFKNCAHFTDCITEMNYTNRWCSKDWSGNGYV